MTRRRIIRHRGKGLLGRTARRLRRKARNLARTEPAKSRIARTFLATGMHVIESLKAGKLRLGNALAFIYRQVDLKKQVEQTYTEEDELNRQLAKARPERDRSRERLNGFVERARKFGHDATSPTRKVFGVVAAICVLAFVFEFVFNLPAVDFVLDDVPVPVPTGILTVIGALALTTVMFAAVERGFTYLLNGSNRLVTQMKDQDSDSGDSTRALVFDEFSQRLRVFAGLCLILFSISLAAGVGFTRISAANLSREAEANQGTGDFADGDRDSKDPEDMSTAAKAALIVLPVSALLVAGSLATLDNGPVRREHRRLYRDEKKHEKIVLKLEKRHDKVLERRHNLLHDSDASLAEKRIDDAWTYNNAALMAESIDEGLQPMLGVFEEGRPAGLDKEPDSTRRTNDLAVTDVERDWESIDRRSGGDGDDPSGTDDSEEKNHLKAVP